MAVWNATRTVVLLAATLAGCEGRIGALGTPGEDSGVGPFDARPGVDVVRPGVDGALPGVDGARPDVQREDVPPSCVPRAELCNGADDDCNGFTDDGLGAESCGEGPCRRMVERCIGGVPQTCTPGAPSAEVCNGIDDDCDGNVDDGLGASSTCGVGACQRTASTCSGGSAGTCTPGAPSAEVCNGVDDDCDGNVDDGLGMSTCGVGACQRTASACVGGAPAACTPGAPTTETCNAIDDDCDGMVDDGVCMMPMPNMLVLVNNARGTGRMCGSTFYPAVPALTWDMRLQNAAQEHSDDMVARNFFDHTGSDGSTVGSRATRNGYGWSAVGENIAAGQTSEEAAMAGWITSPGHCRNIMSANFTQMGSALARGGMYGYYWTQVFARP